MRASLVRRSTLAAALVCAVLVSLSCGGDSGSPSPTPNSILVTPGADTLISIGSHRSFTAQVLDANGDPIDGKTITWSSSAPGILSVDAVTGVATAVTDGPAIVHATSGTLQGSANVVVLQLVAKVVVTPGNVAFTAVGDTARFTAVAKDSGGTAVPGVQILWTTSDNSVATVDTLGLARSKGAGNALVSAQAQAHAGYAAIGVDPTVTQFAVIGAPITVVAGEIPATALQVELRDANGNRAMNSSLAVTVSPAGAASGTPLHGTTTILADQGRATFTGLWFEKAGVDRFRISVAALPVDSGSIVTVAPAAPARVQVDSLAHAQTAGVAVGLVAHVSDRFANPATNFAGPVRVMNDPIEGIGPIFGDTIVDAVAGVATFATTNLHKSNLFYRLVVSLPGLAVPSDSTNVFSVRSAVADQMVLVHTGPVFAPFGHGGDSTVLNLFDAFGNRAGGDTAIVTATVFGWQYTSAPGHGMQIVPGFETAPLLDGQAIFNIGVTRPGRVRFAFSTPGVPPDTSGEEVVGLPNAFFPAVTDGSICMMALFCSGDNAHGELGVDPLLIPHDSLFLFPDSLPSGNVGYFDGGARHFCGIADTFPSGQHTTCWGDNSDGQLGGGTVGGGGPRHVSGPVFNAISAISAGAAHTCIITDSDTECWGKNDQGQLGTGSVGASTGIPAAVTGGHTFIKVAAGGRHTCGLDQSGQVWCWGANDFGQLGDSGASGANSGNPVQVHSNKTFFDITAGEDFTCGSAQGGGNQDVWCWGRNDARQLGPASGDTSNSLPVKAFSEVTLEAGSLAAGAKFVCVTLYDGISVFATECWGANDHGQLGRGTFTPYDSLPHETAVVSDNMRVLGYAVAGAEFICGTSVDPSGQFVCWGRNDHGQFGYGKNSDVATPTLIQNQY